MIVVIFEATPEKGSKTEDSFGIPKKLEPDFKKAEGFISLDRFSSMIEGGEGRVSFLSYWRDKDAIKAWENQNHSSFDKYQVKVINISEIPQ